MLEYVFDPYTGGYEVVTDVIKNKGLAYLKLSLLI